MSDKQIKAPWTDEQVAALNRWQHYGFVHEFTCPNDHDAVLVAHNSGWICPLCDYTQDWAFETMFEEQVNPLQVVVTDRRTP